MIGRARAGPYSEVAVALRAAVCLLGNQLLRPRRRFAGSPNPSLATPQLAMTRSLVDDEVGPEPQISGVLWVGRPSERRLESILEARNFVVCSSDGSRDEFEGFVGSGGLGKEKVITGQHLVREVGSRLRDKPILLRLWRWVDPDRVG